MKKMSDEDFKRDFTKQIETEIKLTCAFLTVAFIGVMVLLKV